VGVEGALTSPALWRPVRLPATPGPGLAAGVHGLGERESPGMRIPDTLSPFVSLPVALAAVLPLLGSGVPVAAQAQGGPTFLPAADAPARTHTAIERAAKKHKRVCLVWGQDASPGHVALRDTLARGKTKAWPFYYEYELVAVDLGADGKANAELARDLGVELGAEPPLLTLLDASGKTLEHRSAAAFRQGEGWDEAALGALLTSHAVEPEDAEEVLSSACTRAEETERRLLVHFGAPW